MPPSKYKIVKDGWGTRSNFQGSYGLGMAPNDLEQGEKILDAMLRANKEEDKEELPESNWVKNNRANYEANGRSLLKEQLARQAVEEYDFAPTGDPEMDIIIGMGLKDMREDDECDYSTDGHGDELVSDEEEVARGLAFFKSRIDFQSFPQAVKTADAEGPGAGSTNETKTSKQLKRQRQRQRAKEKKRLESQK